MQIALYLGWYFSCWNMNNPRILANAERFCSLHSLTVAFQILLPRLPDVNHYLSLKWITNNVWIELSTPASPLIWEERITRVTFYSNCWHIFDFLEFPFHWNDEWTGKNLVIKHLSSEYDQKPHAVPFLHEVCIVQLLVRNVWQGRPLPMLIHILKETEVFQVSWVIILA